MKKFLRLSMILAAAVFFCARSVGGIAVGDAFPAELASLTGVPAQTGGQVCLVDFWASWCAPCKASFAAYDRLNATFASKGLVIVAVSVDENSDDYGSFIRKHSPTFAVPLDRDHRLVARVGVPTMPTCYVIDRHGRVRFMHAGYRGDETDKALAQEVTQLLAEK